MSSRSSHLALSSKCVMISHHTDHRDVRVHFAKRQLVQDLCFSGCLKPNPRDRHLGLAIQSLLDLPCVPTRNRAWSSSLPRINRRMRCSDESSRKIFWSSFSSKVTTCLSDSSWTCCRATFLATLATELPPCVRVQAATPVRSELPIDLLVQDCSAGSCLFGTVVLRIFLCRVRLTTLWILLASADPSPAVALGRCLSLAT